MVLNAGFGCVIGLGLGLIGVPSACCGGCSPPSCALCPTIARDHRALFALRARTGGGSWLVLVLWCIVLFAVVEPVVGHIIEPLLYGRSTGLSPVAVIASATFWTWLWGPIGLVLATPLTLVPRGAGAGMWTSSNFLT